MSKTRLSANDKMVSLEIRRKVRQAKRNLRDFNETLGRVREFSEPSSRNPKNDIIAEQWKRDSVDEEIPEHENKCSYS